MDPRFVALIHDFQAACAQVLAAVLTRTGLPHPFEWRARGLAPGGHLAGEPPLEYQFHGAGLRVQVGGREVDFDFGFDGRTGGFSRWWLQQYAEHGTEEYPEYREAGPVEQQLTVGLATGAIVQPFRAQQDNLYYLASDVAPAI